MNVQWVFMAALVILPFTQVSPLNMDETSKSASPGQIIELVLNVVNFANEVKKKLTDAPSTVINIREGMERAAKSSKDVRFKRSPRNLMMFGVNEREKNEEYGGKSLLERVFGWALEQSDGAKTKVGDVLNCIRGKEQQLMNVEQNVRRELQKCFSLSRVSEEAPQVKSLSVEQDKNLKGDVGKGYLAGEERKEKNDDTVLGYTDGDFSAKLEYGESTEELMKVLLKGQTIDVGGEMFSFDKDHEKEAKINSDEIVDTKMMGKDNNSKIPLVVEDDKKSSEDMEDNSKTFPRSTQENVEIKRNVSESHDLGIKKGANDAEQRTKEDGRTPTKDRRMPNNTDESKIGYVGMNATTPPANNVEVRPSQPSASHSSPSNASCVANAIQTGRQKIDDIVREINYCFIH